MRFKCDTSVKSVTPVQIATKIFEVSRQKVGEPSMHPKVFPGVRKQPKLTRRLSKITEGRRRLPKIAEDHPKTSKDYRGFPKIT